MDHGIVSRCCATAMGCAFTGVVAAQQLEAAEIVESSGNWPWTAVAIVFGLLGVIAFGSRRRIYASIGGRRD